MPTMPRTRTIPDLLGQTAHGRELAASVRRRRSSRSAGPVTPPYVRVACPPINRPVSAPAHLPCAERGCGVARDQRGQLRGPMASASVRHRHGRGARAVAARDEMLMRCRYSVLRSCVSRHSTGDEGWGDYRAGTRLALRHVVDNGLLTCGIVGTPIHSQTRERSLCQPRLSPQTTVGQALTP